MLELVRLLRAVLELLASLRQPLKALLIQPLLTVAMLLALYAGWHIRDQGSIGFGLRVAFLDTRAGRIAYLREVEGAMAQADLVRAAEADKLIDQLLTALLQRAPTAARARLGVIHNGVTGLTGMGLLRYDITNAVAALGHAEGSLVQDRPLSELNAVLPTMLAGQCDMRSVAEVQNLSARFRLEAMGASAVLACPATDVHGKLFGGVFVLWDSGDRLPAGDELKSLTEYARHVSAQIATILDLRAPPPQIGCEGASPSCRRNPRRLPPT